MRAMADSPDLARLTGIDTERVIRTTWIVGAGLAAAAGVLLAYDTHVHTNMGFRMLLPIFASALLGGIGRPYGAMAGGLVIGLAEELSTYPWIGTEPLIPPGYKAGRRVRDHGRNPHLAAERPVPRPGVLTRSREDVRSVPEVNRP